VSARAHVELSLAGQARLVAVASGRASAELSAVLIPACLAWLYQRIHHSHALVPWACGMVAFALLLQRVRKRVQRTAREAPNARALSERVLLGCAISLLAGLLWAAPILLTLGHGDFQFSMILYCTLQGISAASAVYLSAVLAAYYAFLGGIWVVALTGIPWMFPGNWVILLPLFTLFCFVLIGHGRALNRFVVRQVQLEEGSQQLAEQFRGAKEEAEDALRQKELFLTTASHDLRQPANAMSMLVEAISLRNRDTTLVPLLADLRQGMTSLNLMFNSLLDLSRLESGAQSVSNVPLALAPLLREVATLFREQAALRGLALRVYTPRNTIAYVLADAALLRQALVNLVHNALRYTEHGGILIGVRRHGEAWQVDVVDTGVGVATKDEPHIHAPYFRSDQAWRADSAGHGLGLAVVARSARLLGGQHGFRSRRGHGSRFWLRLPAITGEGVECPYPIPPRGERTTFLGGRCLVLDDDFHVLSAWSALLSQWGVDARFARTGAEALATLDLGFEPQAILCDQRLRSGESGFDLLRVLLERCPSASGAMVSGEFQSPELHDAEAEGYLVLRKPVNPETLQAVLGHWLRASESTPRPG